MKSNASRITAFNRKTRSPPSPGLPNTYVSREIGGRQGKRPYNEHRGSPGRERMRAKGKVDRDKAGAIITTFFLLHVPYSQARNYRVLPYDTAGVCARCRHTP